ncbi:hypothetical protein G9A89_016951 [Geosiphon pyriformis]|nr:hypothetical protein G9A89_016951 [Geosiphon pyriformis]
MELPPGAEDTECWIDWFENLEELENISLKLDPEPTIHNSFVNNKSLNMFTTRCLLGYFQKFEVHPRHCQNHNGLWNLPGLQEMMLYFLMANRDHLLLTRTEIPEKQFKNAEKNTESRLVDESLKIRYNWFLPSLCSICLELEHEATRCEKSSVHFKLEYATYEEVKEIVDGCHANERSFFQKISFESYKFEDQASYFELVQLIKRNKITILVLELRNFQFSENVLLEIADALKRNNHIKHLGLYNIKLSSKTCSAMAEVVHYNRTLNHLILDSGDEKSIDFNTNNLIEFRHSLLNNIHLETLRFQWINDHNLSTLNYQGLIKAKINIRQHELASEVGTSISKLLKENDWYNKNQGLAALQFLRLLRVVLFSAGTKTIKSSKNPVKKNLKLTWPLEIWLMIFKSFTEQEGMSQDQVQRVMMFARTTITLLSRITKRQFLNYACGTLGWEILMEDEERALKDSVTLKSTLKVLLAHE